MIVHFTINGRFLTWDEDDIEVYDKLMNDDDFTYEFFQNALRDNKLNDFGLLSSDADDLRIIRHNDILGTYSEEPDGHNSEVSNVFVGTQQEHRDSTGYAIWSTRKQSAEDLEATELLLNLREKYTKEFNDRKTTKNSLWKKIGVEFASAGFNLGGSKDWAEKCRQKLSNMQKAYISFMQHVKRTGEEKKDPPPFFDKLHAIFGSKDFIKPQYVFDSEAPNTSTLDLEVTSDASHETTESHQSIDSSQPSTSQQTEERRAGPSTDTRFKAVKTTPKPTREDKLILMVKECHQQTISAVNRNSENLLNELKKQNDLIEHQNVQKDKLIDLFSEMVQAFKKPRTD